MGKWYVDDMSITVGYSIYELWTDPPCDFNGKIIWVMDDTWILCGLLWIICWLWIIMRLSRKNSLFQWPLAIANCKSSPEGISARSTKNHLSASLGHEPQEKESLCKFEIKEKLVGGVPTPLKIIWKSIGTSIPNIWKNNTIENVPNHQPVENKEK